MRSLLHQLDRLEDAFGRLLARPGTRRLLLAFGLTGAALVALVQMGGATARVAPFGVGRVAYEALVGVSFSAIALWAARRLQVPAEPGPALLGKLVLGLGVGYVLLSFTGLLHSNGPVRVDRLWPRSLPDSLVGLLGATLLGAMGAGLLAVLRAFALHVPKRGARRTFLVMLVLLAVLAPFNATESEAPGTIFVATVLTLAVVFNAARLAWVVQLTQRQKWTTIGLCIALIVLLVLALESASAERALGSTSLWLKGFVEAAWLYGILFGSLGIFFTVFHLPTTTVYRRQAEERKAMRSFSDLLGEAFDRQRLAEAVTHAPVAAGLAARTWLVLDTPEGFEVAATHGLTVDEARAETTSALLSDAGEPISARRVTSVPLVAGGRTLGALVAERREDTVFTRDDAEALSLFAAQAALALDHARLFAEQIEKERLQRELDIARDVQQRLLPQRLPELTGLGLCASSVSALEVGGDYYDLVRLDDDRLAVIVADVSGKGTSAAFFMAEMQGAFRALVGLGDDPVALLARADAVLGPMLDAGTFVTALYGVFDARAATFTFARAGHCPLAVVPTDAEAPVRFVRAPGLGLGLDRRGRFARFARADTVTVAPGDALVLFTDGLVESRNPEGDEFGYDRLADLLARLRGRGAEALHDGLLDGLRAFLRGEPYTDDTTLLVLDWSGRPVEEGGTGWGDGRKDRNAALPA
jgi:phosphoserine phosphatase RsbU/P